MYIYLTAAPALLIAISAFQASAQPLPVAAVDFSSFFNRQHRRAERKTRHGVDAFLNHDFYHAQTLSTRSTQIISTTATQYQSASIFNPAMPNHELYRAGAVTEPSTISEAATSATTQSLNAAKIDSATWNTQTKAACETALRNLNGHASNAAGLAVCYNLPGLNTSTGAFQVDLRLYRVAAPAHGWKLIFDQTVSVAMYYPGATVGSQDANKRRRDDHTLIWNQIGSVKAGELHGRADDVHAPQILQTFHLIGQINDDMMGEVANQ